MRPSAVRYDVISLQYSGMEIFLSTFFFFLKSTPLIVPAQCSNSLGPVVTEGSAVKYTCECAKIPAIMCYTVESKKVNLGGKESS